MCSAALVRFVCLMTLLVFGCFAIASLGPTDSTVRPAVVRERLHTINQERQHVIQPVQPVESVVPPKPGPPKPEPPERAQALGRAAARGLPTKPPASAVARRPAAGQATFVPWDGEAGLERWQSASYAHGAAKSVFAWKREPRPEAPAGDECLGHGVYDPRLEECRCTAGWAGRLCHARALRPCNAANDPRAKINTDALCAGNCDDERGLCYCAGHKTPFQRSLPHVCAPATTKRAKLPDGRPLYPTRGKGGDWQMANLIWERSAAAWTKSTETWARPWAKPIELVYGKIAGNPKLKPVAGSNVGWCEAKSGLEGDGSEATPRERILLRCTGCYEGRTGPFCEHPKQSYCLRDCSGRGRCDSGFCWCQKGWFGVDCSQNLAQPAGAPLMQRQQRVPSPAASSPLRIYVYDMPAEFTTRNLQWRNGATMGNHRAYDGQNRSYFAAGSLYAMEMALHEWLLDSPLRTTDAAEAQLFFVPMYLASLFMWPISKWADVPYYGREKHENKRRSHQGSLFMLSALRYIRTAYPFWDAAGGRDHVFMMLHDEGPCFCPRDIRPAMLLTHYGYYSKTPRPWGTYYDDNFMQDPSFYDRYLGDAKRPTPCFKRGKDIVISPWKTPEFWRKALADPALRGRDAATRPRSGLVFFAGDLGFNRLPGYSHDLRQIAHALFCDPRRGKRDCTPVAGGKCRKDMPMNCSGWVPGVTITTHSSRYHDSLKEHTFCLAFPGDGWSSRVLDGITHGCIPVVIQDESEMFFEGSFADAGLPIDYANFSIRLSEAELPQLVQRLRAVPPERVVALRRAGLWVRDYFIYKDMFNPKADERRGLLATGRPKQDAFLLLALALESRARTLGKLRDAPNWRERNRALLGYGARADATDDAIVEGGGAATHGRRLREEASEWEEGRDWMDNTFGVPIESEAATPWGEGSDSEFDAPESEPEVINGRVEVWD